jgi:hypothetical protein
MTQGREEQAANQKGKEISHEDQDRCEGRLKTTRSSCIVHRKLGSFPSKCQRVNHQHPADQEGKEKAMKSKTNLKAGQLTITKTVDKPSSTLYSN